MRSTTLLARSSEIDHRSPKIPHSLIRYGLSVMIFGVTIGLAFSLRYLEIRLNMTIPVVLALVLAAWFGGKGPGLLVAVLFQATTLAFATVPADLTLPQIVFSHFSILALYVFLVLGISALKNLRQARSWDGAKLRESENISARRALELKTLYEFTDRIQYASSMEEVYEAALDAMFRTLECDRASILLFDSAGVMRFVAARGLSEGYQRAVEGHSPWEPGERDPRPFGISDLGSAGLEDQLRSTIEREGIAALGFIPLVSDKRLMGKMMVYFDRFHEFTDIEFEMARTVGNQIASGVELKRTQTRLLENEERLRLATETGKVGVWDWNVRKDQIEWTDAVFEIHGVEKDLFDGTLGSFKQMVHPDDRERVRDRIEMALAGERPYDLELRIQRPDGSTRTLFTNAVVLRDDDGPFRMIGATVDITERLQFEKARRESEIMHRLVEAQESERHRIARDLHDHLGQRMTGLRLQIETLTRQLEKGDSFSATLQHVKNAAMQIDRDIGFLSWELRPTELENLGLADALGTFVSEWSEQYGIAAEFQSMTRSGNGSRLPEAVETNLYRIVQEALNNVLKHADAKEVNVLLEHRKNALVLTVEDDGRGFEESADKLSGGDGNGSRGLGLIGMQERAALIKGTLEIDSSYGNGTTVIARIPLAGHSFMSEEVVHPRSISADSSF